jgi:hypothetical protein
MVVRFDITKNREDIGTLTISEVLMIDLKNAINNTADNFTTKLFQLMLKADESNTWKLASVYQKEYEVLQAWQSGRIDLDKLELKKLEMKRLKTPRPPLNLRG